MHHTLAPPTVAVARPLNSQADLVEDEGLTLLRRKFLDADVEFQHFGAAQPAAGGLRDLIFATEHDPVNAEQAFADLRWGGQFVYVSKDRKVVAALAERLPTRGFTLTRGPAVVRGGWGLPFFSPASHYLIARKTSLIPPREFSDRFTYQVALESRADAQADGSAEKATDHWVVCKEVPSYERVLTRLQFKAPEIPLATLERRAHKLVEQVFPLFLTREAALLKVIERDCPTDYRHRFPRVVQVEKDSKGYVQRMWTTWLRNGGKPLTQLEFARQSAELLHVLHDRVGIIHLDLRMDNMVVTEAGVGFVDFGSAVRVNENIQGNTVLATLFDELMRTSQIQRMIDRMASAGSITSPIIREAYQRTDKAVDLFYLALQISQPATNPDLRDLVQYDVNSDEAYELLQLTQDVLRPVDPARPRYRSAYELLEAIQLIQQQLKNGVSSRAKVVITGGGPAPRTTEAAPAAPSAPSAAAPSNGKAKVWIWDS